MWPVPDHPYQGHQPLFTYSGFKRIPTGMNHLFNPFLSATPSLGYLRDRIKVILGSNLHKGMDQKLWQQVGGQERLIFEKLFGKR